MEELQGRIGGDVKMDRIEKGEKLTLDNNKEYGVVDIVEQEGKRYLYLVNPIDIEVFIAEEKITNNEIYMELVEEMDKIHEISEIVLKRAKAQYSA